MSTPTENTVSVGGIELHTLDSETPGPTILCVHGRRGRGRTWTDFIARYASAFRVIAPDLRGHGRSSQPVGRYTSDELAADLAGLLREMDAGPALVVGHSSGGRVATYLAAQHPDLVSALSILDQGPSGPAELSELPLSEMPPRDSLTGDWPQPFESEATARAFILDRAKTDFRAQYYLDSLVPSNAGWELLFSQQAMRAMEVYSTSWFHLLPEIQCPAMLLRARGGTEVPDADWSEMQRLLPQAQSFEVSRPDHHVYLSDPDEFYACFDAFLTGL